MATTTHLEDEKYTNTTACADNCATVERKGDRVTTDASAVTCWRCLARMTQGYATDTCPTVPPNATECTGFRGIEAQNNRFRVTCNVCGFSGPWRSEPIRAVMEWNFYVRAVRRGMERLPLAGVPTAPPSDHVNNPAPPAPAPAPPRGDGWLSNSAAVRDIAEEVAALRAGTNEALAVLSERIKAVDAKVSDLDRWGSVGRSSFPKHVPTRRCSTCGSNSNPFSSPVAEMCMVCSKD